MKLTVGNSLRWALWNFSDSPHGITHLCAAQNFPWSSCRFKARTAQFIKLIIAHFDTNEPDNTRELLLHTPQALSYSIHPRFDRNFLINLDQIQTYQWNQHPR